MKQHRVALVIVAVSAVLVVLDGWAFSAAVHIAFWHGVYCIWMTAITVGGDVAPARWGYACLAFAPFPLLAAAFSLFTSALAGISISDSEERIKKSISARITSAENGIKAHVEARLRHHLGDGGDV